MSYEFISSPNNSSRNGNSIDGIILHFTGGGDIEGTIRWLCHPESKASAHYVVSRSGRVVQLIKEERAAWHAGSPSTTPKLNGRKNLNKWTIGIEICNWGWLYEPPVDETVSFKGKTLERKAGEKYVRMKKWTTLYKGKSPLLHIVKIKESKALKYNMTNRNWPGGNACFWEPYPKIQMEAVKKLVQDIVERRPHITDKWIATHTDVDPTRKLDMVGYVFDFEWVIDSVFADEEEVKEFQIDRSNKNNANIDDMKEAYEPRADKKSGWCLS